MSVQRSYVLYNHSIEVCSCSQYPVPNKSKTLSELDVSTLHNLIRWLLLPLFPQLLEDFHFKAFRCLLIA